MLTAGALAFAVFAGVIAYGIHLELEDRRQCGQWPFKRN
jgi:hypothetical protein